MIHKALFDDWEEQKEMLQDILLSMQDENRRLRKENIQQRQKIRRLDGNYDEFYTFTTPKIALSPGDNGFTVEIKIPKECDFWVTKLVKSGSDFEFQIDSSNGRSWSNGPLDCEVGAGSAGSPMVLPKPRFIARASTISIKLINKIHHANKVSVALVGYKSYWVEN